MTSVSLKKQKLSHKIWKIRLFVFKNDTIRNSSRHSNVGFTLNISKTELLSVLTSIFKRKLLAKICKRRVCTSFLILWEVCFPRPAKGLKRCEVMIVFDVYINLRIL